MSHAAIGVYERAGDATANVIGVYDLEPTASAPAFMDGVMTEEEWYSWRRRRRYAEHLFEWRNKKGPIY